MAIFSSIFFISSGSSSNRDDDDRRDRRGGGMPSMFGGFWGPSPFDFSIIDHTIHAITTSKSEEGK